MAMPFSNKVGGGREDIPGLRSPSRMPWIVLVVLAIVLAGFGLKRQWTRSARAAGMRESDVASELGRSSVESIQQPRSQAAGDVNASLTPSASQLVASVRAMMGSGQIAEARGKCFTYLSSPLPPTDRHAVEAVLGDVNTALFFSAAPAEEKSNQVVRAGDSLEAIARRHGTTVELLQKSNGIAAPSRIRQGDVIRVLIGRFRIEVWRSRMELVLYLNDRFFKRYPVGIGKESRTPLGTFTVSDRIVEPVWWRPDGRQIPFGNPENILGTRWLALRATAGTADVKGYGIHGTWDDKSIGKAESAGCVRMKNSDVEQLFDLVPLGTPVTILDP